MAHTKAKGTSKLGRDSISKRLGVKIFGGQVARAGAIIIRQRGSKFYAGENVGIGKDDTLFAKIKGAVHFEKHKIKKFTGNIEKKQIVSIKPVE